jgi:hypothetical protein
MYAENEMENRKMIGVCERLRVGSSGCYPNILLM